MRSAAAARLWVLMALFAGSLLAANAPAALPKGAEDYRAAWRTFATPEPGPKGQPTLGSRQRAYEAAIPKIQAAVAADSGNMKYRTALVYILLTAGRYDKAKKAVDEAIQKERRDPLLYLLRAQAEAALAQQDPVTASKKIGPAITALDRAAELDPTNSLPLLQAVSVALDLDRIDLALPRLDRALERPDCRLYNLSVPFDLDPDGAKAVDLWQQIQYSHWLDLLARCQNAERGVIRLGNLEGKSGKLDAAQARYEQARQIARKVGRAKPYGFVTVGISIDMLNMAYERLATAAAARSAEAKQRVELAKKAGQDPAAATQEAARWDNEAQKWNGERGVLTFGSGELRGAIADYQKQVTAHPPSSIEEMTELQSVPLLPIMAGIGLDPEKPAAPQAPGGKPTATRPQPSS